MEGIELETGWRVDIHGHHFKVLLLSNYVSFDVLKIKRS